MSTHAITEGRAAGIYGSFDVTRVAAAVLVASIHIFSPPNAVVRFVLNDTLSRVAVPFFFAAAGFFGAGRDVRKIKAYLGRVGLLYLFWTAIYLPVVISPDVSAAPRTLAELFTLYAVRLLYLGVSGHLWFYPALLPAMTLAWLLRSVNPRRLCLLTMPLFIFAVVIETYYGILPAFFREMAANSYYSIFPNARNGLLFGFFFVTLGAFIKSRPPIKAGTAATGLVFSAALLFAESALIERLMSFRDRNLYLSLAPFTYFLLCLLRLWRPAARRPEACGVFRSLREMSVIIYGAHVLVHYSLLRVFPALASRPLAAYLAALLLSALCYPAVRMASRCRYLRFLRRLY